MKRVSDYFSNRTWILIIVALLVLVIVSLVWELPRNVENNQEDELVKTLEVGSNESLAVQIYGAPDSSRLQATGLGWVEYVLVWDNFVEENNVTENDCESLYLTVKCSNEKNEKGVDLPARRTYGDFRKISNNSCYVTNILCSEH